MYPKWKWIGLGMLVWGCQVNTGVEPYAPSPSLQPSSGWSPTPTAAATPSAENSPSPSPNQMPTPLPPEVNGLEAYNLRANIFCASERATQQQLRPSIAHMTDFAVHANGQQLYLLYSARRLCQSGENCSGDVISKDLLDSLLKPCSDHEICTTRIISRQSIYELNTQGQFQRLQPTGSKTFTCNHSSELEKDHQNHLWVHMPIHLTEPGNYPPIGHRLVEWNISTGTAQERWRQMLAEDNPSLSPLSFGPNQSGIKRYIRGLYTQITPKATQIYYALDSYNDGSGMQTGGSLIQKIAPQDQILHSETLLESPDTNIRSFAVRPDGEMILWYTYAPRPYPLLYEKKTWNQATWKPIFTNQPIQGRPLPQDMKVNADQIAYFIEGQRIWQVDLQTYTVSPLAGSDQPGYQDGLGQAARFNQPYKLDLDTSGNIYVFDKDNLAIRKITPSGQVTTFYREEPHAP